LYYYGLKIVLDVLHGRIRVLKTTRLRELRERASFSQMELSERSGVSRATIADLELGKRGARPKTRRKLAKALGVEPWELVGDAQGR
jgi:transcriptional regulator with XRE-family HTH domain